MEKRQCNSKRTLQIFKKVQHDAVGNLLHLIPESCEGSRPRAGWRRWGGRRSSARETPPFSPGGGEGRLRWLFQVNKEQEYSSQTCRKYLLWIITTTLDIHLYYQHKFWESNMKIVNNHLFFFLIKHCEMSDTRRYIILILNNTKSKKKTSLWSNFISIIYHVQY